MAQDKKRARFVVVFVLFAVYFFGAARPIPLETVLSPRWISSLEAGDPVIIDGIAQQLPGVLPFTLGNHFGYVDSAGYFPINKIKTGNIYLSEKQWVEYDAEPSKIDIMNVDGETTASIDDPRGYPVLLDNRVFILGSEQNSLSEIDKNGNALWTYDFSAPLTCIDAAAGLVLTGSIDGVVEILDLNGRRIFFFEPGGSRFSVILGCALSSNGLRLGIICGIEDQRFLLLERYGGASGEYKVIYHEFLDTGFRRPVHIEFIDQDRRVIFERPLGIGCYNIKSRRGIRIPLNGTIAAIENSGDQGFLFLICSDSVQQKKLIGIKFPQDRWLPLTVSMRDMIFLEAAFKSDNVYLNRTGNSIVAGGGATLISFDLEKK
ncbi:MAG: PQQ-like beta-propeller repeat protein [Treponema sp.]|nr:PQQ-like beta-propeller repeat protein [Treponema sp.]